LSNAADLFFRLEELENIAPVDISAAIHVQDVEVIVSFTLEGVGQASRPVCQ
jgi:hypothetical protein